MIDGYEIVDGVIHKVCPEHFVYTQDYVAKYLKYPVKELSSLRVNWIKGALGHLPNSVLDFGAGIGAFLKCYHERSGAAVYAYDVVDYPMPHPVKRVQDPTTNAYELVTFYDSLEHVLDLSVIGRVKCRYLCISVPWCHNISDSWLNSWKHLRPNEHIWHFNPESLVRTCQRFGFNAITFGSPEDAIRKPSDSLANILTAIFEKRAT